MGPIRVLYGQKSLYGAQVGPKWDKCPESAHMVPIYTCLLVKSLPIWDLYRSYMGKKACMGPMQDSNGINAQILPIWVPYIHVCWAITRMGVCSRAELLFPFIFFCFMVVLISVFCSGLFCIGDCHFLILVVYSNYFILLHFTLSLILLFHFK